LKGLARPSEKGRDREIVLIMYPHFFDWRKETAVPVKETPFYPCVAPATAVPYQGDKRHHRTHCDSESPPSPLGVGNGFQFTSFARLYLQNDDIFYGSG
ncbi:MAG: hypothetical protein IJP05_07775, partial [Oscillospiraceae bacterium]|nr:hypothetical protein [Oscillospiraceae bacterium]